MNANTLKAIHLTCLTLVVIGAINWGLVGLFQFDLVAEIFGGQSATLSRVIYTLVGLAGIGIAYTGSRSRPVLTHSDQPHIRRAA